MPPIINCSYGDCDDTGARARLNSTRSPPACGRRKRKAVQPHRRLVGTPFFGLDKQALEVNLRFCSTSEAVMALRLTMAFSDNPRVQPLKDGAVKRQGIDLDQWRRTLLLSCCLTAVSGLPRIMTTEDA
jgi:hypothetical protein